ncbi:PRMT5 [Symbiodinium natans]|uniref:PRMT5 protein n=1 Tax=Symbiodinium natans TaxID=878477 RepID=A0A812GKM3_9DINO|nr:PRMT5 [Symbiodinium natans]
MWLPQISMLPFVMLCTASTSALWCTPEGVVLSLGPVPLCIFRRRIPYRDITSVAVVRGRKSVATTMAKNFLRLWQPFGYVYALTLGKDVVDIRLRHCKEKGVADSSSPALPENLPSSWLPWHCCNSCTLLVSVDKADDVVAHAQFRSEHGPLAPLPDSLRSNEVQATAKKWVVCDIFEMLLSWHARNRVACDACSLLLQPFQEVHLIFFLHQ